MSKGDGAALGVDLLEGDAQLLDAPHALRRERLVDLVDVDILLGDAGFLERDGDGLPGPDAHEQRLHADHAGRDVLAEDLLAQALGGRALHEQHGGRAVRDLRRVARGDGAILGEGRADLGERFGRDARADAVVGLDGDGLDLVRLGVRPLHREGHDLLVEEARLLRLLGLLVRRRGEGVLLRARDVAVLGHLLRQHAHGYLAVGRFRVALEQLGEFGDGAGAGKRVSSHSCRNEG